MSKRNDWERRFGAKRRSADRKLLEEVERSIAIEEAVAHALFLETDARFEREWNQANRDKLSAGQRIAQAYGRPYERDI